MFKTCVSKNTFHAKIALVYLLSEWEEPETSGRKSKATVRDLVEFRNAKSHMDDQYPFSYAFGHVSVAFLLSPLPRKSFSEPIHVYLF